MSQQEVTRPYGTVNSAGASSSDYFSQAGSSSHAQPSVDQSAFPNPSFENRISADASIKSSKRSLYGTDEKAEVYEENSQTKSASSTVVGISAGNRTSGHGESRRLEQQTSTIELESPTYQGRMLARAALCISCAGVSRKAGIGQMLVCRCCRRVFEPSESLQSVVAQGNGIFCGIWPADKASDILILFQSRETGNTLALPLLFITAVRVREVIEESNQKFQKFRVRGK